MDGKHWAEVEGLDGILMVAVVWLDGKQVLVLLDGKQGVVVWAGGKQVVVVFLDGIFVLGRELMDYKLVVVVKLVVVRVYLLDGTALEILELWLDDKGWEI